MQEKIINVLVVDDSALMRRMIIDILSKNPRIKVIGYAINGQMAITQVEKLNPDVVTLDVEMPFMNGLEALKEIQKIKPTPVVMLSSLTKAGAEVTLQALELGAVDFIQKPDSNKAADLKQIEEDLANKVIAAASVVPSRMRASLNVVKHSVEVPMIKTTPKVSRVKTVVIGSSTGGPQSLKEVLPYLPADLPAQVLMVQHMPPKFTDLLAQRLDKISPFAIKEAKDNDLIEAQHALMAPGGYHMVVEGCNKVRLNQEPPVWGVRPAVDLTLASAAKVFKEDLICVILTGMGRDGTKGAEAVKKFGGYVIAEDKSTAIIYGMPKSVIDAGHADEVAPLHRVASAIVKAVYR